MRRRKKASQTLGATVQNLGPYESEGEMIGRGSFATVYKGRHKDSGREVAIKAMFPEKLKEKKRLQDREVAIMKSMQHPNVVELLDVFVTEDEARGTQTVCMVFELCKGGDYAAYLERHEMRRISEERARHWFRQLANGLMFLRERNIIHRDLKPQNLLLSTADEDTALLKLADFGFARFTTSHSLIETMCGTPLYMAPEILRSEKYSIKSDLWSVGCMLYESVVGRAPFKVRTHFELIRRLEREEAEIPLEVRSTLSPALVELITGLLNKDDMLRMPWKTFFNHPWFAGEVPADWSPQPASKRVGNMLANEDFLGHAERHYECAVACVEIADFRMASSPDESLVLYWKAGEALEHVLRSLLKQQPKVSGSQEGALVERTNTCRNALHHVNKRLAYVHKKCKRYSLGVLKSPTELLLEYGLKMGQGGGVNEILGDYEKAEKMYENGCVVLELLFFECDDVEDKGIIKEYLVRFNQRLTTIRQLMYTE